LKQPIEFLVELVAVRTPTLQKRICYFSNYMFHQSCNCCYGIMGRYYNSPSWWPAMGNTVHME